MMKAKKTGTEKKSFSRDDQNIINKDKQFVFDAHIATEKQDLFGKNISAKAVNDLINRLNLTDNE